LLHEGGVDWSISGTSGETSFNPDFDWDYDPSNGVGYWDYCFQSVAIHEVGHVLGFISRAESWYQPNSDIYTLDIFRFQRTDGAGNYNPDTYSQFQSTPRLVDYNNPNDNHNSNTFYYDGSDIEYRMADGNTDQASHFRYSVYALMAPSFGSGDTYYPDFFKTPDLDMFDAIGWDYSGSVDPPMVNTNPATNVEEITTTLNGYLSDDGGEPCTVRFEYGFSTSYGTYTSTQTKSSGESFSQGITSLNRGQLYHYRALASNSNPTGGYGADEIFLTKPYPPYSFTATTFSENQINLNWNNGDGAERVYIVRKTGSYPVDRSDGVNVFYNSGTSYQDTGLNPDITYFYRAWSHVDSGGLYQWSDSFDQDYAQTDPIIYQPEVDSIAATDVEETSATLNGYLQNDGGESCTVYFQYGDTPSYGWYSTEQVKNSGEYFAEPIYALNKGQIYHFRSIASNSYPNFGYGEDEIFLTKPDEPYAMSATTIDEDQINIAWSKGTGADNTFIVRKVGSYPTNRADGINIYYNTGTNYQDIGLDPGTHYYYRAWSRIDSDGIFQWSDYYDQDDAITEELNNPPNTPYNPHPLDGESNVTITTDISWSGGDPDPGDTVTYDVYFDSLSPPNQVASNQTNNLWNTPGDLEYDTQYYWKIVSWDDEGERSLGDEWYFITGSEPNEPPYVPSNPNPEDGAIDVFTYADLSWTGGDPNPGDTVTYDIYFGNSNPPPLNESGWSINSYDPGTLDYETTYYWKIVSHDGEYSVDGPIWSFTTKEEVPGFDYVPGDVNGDGRIIGSDVTFLVNYFRGLGTPPFEVDGFYPAADVNGDCLVIGSDVTFLVQYFRGVQPEIRYCPQYPPI